MRYLSTILLWALSVSAAQAAPCLDRGSALALLQGRYGETLRFSRASASAGLLELHASAQSGSWTITVTSKGGQTCLVASGHGFALPGVLV